MQHVIYPPQSDRYRIEWSQLYDRYARLATAFLRVQQRIDGAAYHGVVKRGEA